MKNYIIRNFTWTTNIPHVTSILSRDVEKPHGKPFCVQEDAIKTLLLVIVIHLGFILIQI